MTRITIDAELSGRLEHHHGPVELVDETGRLLGSFLPTVSPQYPKGWVPELDREGFDATVREEGGVSTDELLSRLPSG